MLSVAIKASRPYGREVLKLDASPVGVALRRFAGRLTVSREDLGTLMDLGISFTCADCGHALTADVHGEFVACRLPSIFDHV